MPEHAKKHHYVPQFLLKYFADKRGKLVIHQVGREHRYNSTVRDIGHRNYGHSVYRPGGEPDHVSMEAAMSGIEGDAATVVRELVQSWERAVPEHARHALAWLLALQWQRSRFLRHAVTKRMGEPDEELSDEEVQSAWMRLISRTVIDPWYARNDEAAHYKDQWNHLVATLLTSDLHWSCYRPRGGGLLVGDNTVCLSGVVGPPPPDIPRGFFDHGVGMGFHNFRRLTVPLGSRLALIISRSPHDASQLRVADLNRFTVYNSREFVAHAPEWGKNQPSRAHELRELLEVQRMVAPAFLQGYATNGRT